MGKNKRVVVLSTNNNPDYYFYIPYQEKAWNSYGWSICIVVTDDVDISQLSLTTRIEGNDKYSTSIITMPAIEGVRKETMAQAGRLYVAKHFEDDDLLMTCDMDLIPLKNYWHPDLKDITVYGHDLTWHSFYPMGYIAMSARNWKKYMNLIGDIKADFERDAKEIGLAYRPDWDQWWNHDWTLITNRLKPFEKQIKFVDRGQIDIAGATLALGRVDRYNWEKTQEQPDWIDAHCHNTSVTNPERLESFLKVYEKVHGKI